MNLLIIPVVDLKLYGKSARAVNPIPHIPCSINVRKKIRETNS